MESKTPTDVKNTTFNIQTEEHPLRNLESSMSKSFNSLAKKMVANRPEVEHLKSHFELSSLKTNPPQPILSMAERYKIAWKLVYKKLDGFRRKEIDSSLKNGTFGESERDMNFVKLVASEAETNLQLEA